MKILLTNDDGVGSPGLTLLAAALREAGHRVFVFAPASDQSGVSHAISFFHSPCKVSEIGEDTWVCQGTPVDCVVLALMGGVPELYAVGLPEERYNPPDLVISGINRGANLGTDILFSGTASAARQGALYNIPSLAFSLAEAGKDGKDSTGDPDTAGGWYWDMAVAFIVEHLDRIRECWKPDSFINVNIPNQKEKPCKLVHAFPSLRYYNDSIDIYQAPDGCRYCFTRVGKVSAKQEQGSDCEVVAGNNASLSAIYIRPPLFESVTPSAEGAPSMKAHLP
jgi:5'-nucleotidase